ncbi:MAG TPA: hypothetical protein VK197_09130, partial [Verrucomicrobiae bacterium]|nr:hypothetical protein [Verrucomicrobiae bacterium]
MPLALGVGRFWMLYLTPGDDIWVQYRSLALYPSDALVGVAVTAWLVSRAAGGRAPATPPSRSLAIGLAALALAAAASALSAVDPVLALGTAVHLAVLGLFLIVAADLAAARPALVVRAVCVAVVVQTAFALAQAVTQSTAPAG